MLSVSGTSRPGTLLSFLAVSYPPRTKGYVLLLDTRWGFLVALDGGLERRPDLKAGDSYSASPVDDYNPAGTSTGGSAEL
uniref:WGS project CBMG000000000 data, contig CS5907-c000822 n=1 Tax=Fusarium acuminatum CS5907 TaxID=1318461 RepID=A0A096PF29_9HYPO|nr:unnamed protein product [Fusarium acuminatum CS5907]